jgi:hypothetical protein
VAELKLSLNRDNTITVRVGRARETFTLDGKSRAELWDWLKWTSISKGVRMSDVEVTEALDAVLRDSQ